MDQQTQKTILISIIVSTLTATPLALVFSFFIISFYAPQDQQGTMETSSSLQEVLEQTAPTTVSMVEENTSVEEPFLEVLVPNSQTSATEEGRKRIEATFFTTDKAIYQLKTTYTTSTAIPMASQSIERTDIATGEKQIWLEDITRLASPEIEPFEEFRIYANPKNGTTLFLDIYQDGVEPFGKALFTFSLEDQSVEKLLVSSQIEGSLVRRSLSPNAKQLLFVKEGVEGLDQSLLLVDLMNDSITPILSLSGNETFSGAYPGGQNFIGIEWVDNENIRYDVYDQSLKEALPVGISSEESLRIETRVFRLPNV